jgi:hypothetical protein
MGCHASLAMTRILGIGIATGVLGLAMTAVFFGLQFDQAIAQAFSTIFLSDISGWFRYDGYAPH